MPFPSPLQPLSHLVKPQMQFKQHFLLTVPPRILSLFLEIHPGRIPNKAPIHSHVRVHLTHLCILRANHIISNQRGKRLTGASASECIDSPCFSGAPGQREALRRNVTLTKSFSPGPDRWQSGIGRQRVHGCPVCNTPEVLPSSPSTRRRSRNSCRRN